MSCFKSNVSINNMNQIKLNYPEAVNYDNEINNYINNLNKRRTKYFLFIYATNTLRFFQTLSGLGITILTTNNNPYFVENEKMISIYLWYLAIFSTLTNTTLELLQRKYNVINKKIIIDLLKGESIKLVNERCPYDKHNYPNHHNKLIYFKDTINHIEIYNQGNPIIGLSMPPERATPPLPNDNNESNIPETIIDNYTIEQTEPLQNQHEIEKDEDDISLFGKIYKFLRS